MGISAPQCCQAMGKITPKGPATLREGWAVLPNRAGLRAWLAKGRPCDLFSGQPPSVDRLLGYR